MSSKENMQASEVLNSCLLSISLSAPPFNHFCNGILTTGQVQVVLFLFLYLGHHHPLLGSGGVVWVLVIESQFSLIP